MRVLLRNPRREVEMPGPLAVHALLERLEINRESVLVIRADTLVTGDAVLQHGDVVEIRCAFCKLRARATAGVVAPAR